MTSLARVTFLGTGTSHGVPMIGCDCAVCRSDDPRDRRWRPSILIELADGTSVLVDTSPDLRAQALAFDVRRVDAILFTHAHADHVLGLDEVRRYNAMQRAPIPCYGDEQTVREVRRTFAYLTDCSAIPDSSWPLLEGVQVLVIDALRDRRHPTHFTVAEALEVVRALGPRAAYLTHICHDLSHAATNARLPAGVEVAYDGLRLQVHGD